MFGRWIDDDFYYGFLSANVNGLTKLALCTAALPELQPAPLFPVCHYWTNELIQVCLTSVVATTIIIHTWINQ